MGQPLTQCPYKFLGADLRNVETILDAAEFVTKGAGWPAPGGWADQTASCVEGVKCVWAANREIDARIEGGKGEY